MDALSILVALAVAVFVFVTQIRREPGRRLFGVYSQPGRWYRVKYAAFLLLLRLRRLRLSRRSRNDDVGGMGVASRNSEAEMERPQTLPDAEEFPHAVDAVYFNGADENKNFIVMAASRRQRGLMQCISILRLAGIGMLEHPKQPDTNFAAAESDKFANSDLEIVCEEPMKTWRIRFDGEMLLCQEGYGLRRPLRAASRSGRRVRVRMDLTWRATHPHFDFDTDQETHALAEAVAAEPWSKEFFENLKSMHQTHVEQFGEVTGPVHIDDKLVADLQLRGVRDHSFGNRRIWSDLYRYGLQYICLDDATCIAVGCVSMPEYLSNLIIGFVCSPEGRVSPIRHSDFRLFNEGQDGRPPQEFSVNCRAGGKVYRIRCRVTDQSVFHMGEAKEAKIFERFCRFEVNGVKGWGISEWCYRNSETWEAWAEGEKEEEDEEE